MLQSFDKVNDEVISHSHLLRERQRGDTGVGGLRKEWRRFEIVILESERH